MNDRVSPFFDEEGVKLQRVLTDRRTEYCGNPEHHEYELYLAVEDIDHSRTKTKSPQTNGIVERFTRPYRTSSIGSPRPWSVMLPWSESTKRWLSCQESNQAPDQFVRRCWLVKDRHVRPFL